MRLIDAEALMTQLEKKKTEPGKQRYTEGFNDALMRFRSMIHSAHTIDAVEVVRCSECVLFGIYERFDNGHCRHHDGLMYPKPTDFCSHGKRRKL